MSEAVPEMCRAHPQTLRGNTAALAAHRADERAFFSAELPRAKTSNTF